MFTIKKPPRKERLTENNQTKAQKAVMVYEDGNGHEHARQEIPYTDFPMADFVLYCCWDGEYWVLMLPSEY